MARTHPRRHSSNNVAYVAPEMPKININGIKTLPQDLHLGANLTGNVVQVSSLSFSIPPPQILVPYTGFLLLPSPQFGASQPSSNMAAMTTSHGALWKHYWHYLGRKHIALFMIIPTEQFHTHSNNTCTSHAQYNCRAKAPRGFKPFIF